MGAYLSSKNVGDQLRLSGPMGYFNYKGDGLFTNCFKGERKITKLGLIAGGSGITPLFNIAQAIYRAKETHIDVKLLYSNRTRNDITLQDRLERI